MITRYYTTDWCICRIRTCLFLMFLAKLYLVGLGGVEPPLLLIFPVHKVNKNLSLTMEIVKATVPSSSSIIFFLLLWERLDLHQLGTRFPFANILHIYYPFVFFWRWGLDSHQLFLPCDGRPPFKYVISHHFVWTLSDSNRLTTGDLQAQPMIKRIRTLTIACPLFCQLN